MRRNGGAGPGPSKVHHLIWNSPRGAMWSSTGAPQMLTPLVKEGDLLDLAMLDAVKKNPMAPPVPAEGVSLLEPRVKEPINLPAANELPASGPEQDAHSGELALVWRRLPLAPPGFTCSLADESSQAPLEDADLPVSTSLGAQLDLSSLGSLKVTVFHYPVMGEVQYQYLSQVIAQTSLQLTLSEPSEQPDYPPWIEEL